MRKRRVAAIAVAVIALLGWVGTTDEPAAAVGRVATPGQPVRTVGALFTGSLDDGHSCTASVLHSRTHDLVLTAAHCLSGSGVGATFVPGYDEGQAPEGTFRVVAAYVDPQWVADQDPDHDYAVLRVEPTSGDRPVERVTGGEALGSTPRAGTRITDAAYVEGVDDQQLSCTAPVALTGGVPSFACGGYAEGTSGSPWLVREPGARRATVVGVIGGKDQGGCLPTVSFSSPFGADVRALLHRAESRAPGDTLPVPGDSGC